MKKRDLQTVEKLLSKILELSVEAVVAVDSDQKIVYANRGAVEVFGYSKADLIGADLNLLIPEHFHGMHTHMIRQFIDADVDSKHMRKRGEIQALRKNGEEFPATASISKVAIDGQVFVAAILQDVSERKGMESGLKQAAEVFEQAREGIVILDPRGNVITANSAFQQISGFTLDEIVGADMAFMRTDQQDHLFYKNMILTIRKHGFWQGEVWCRRKSGEPYLVFASVGNTVDENGRLISYIASYSDITLMRESEDKLDHQANHDFLTNLPNRKLVNDRLNQALIRAQRSGKKVAVLFMDIDRFKSINDSMGYLVGDTLLQKVAERLICLARKEDTLGRLVGDEFVFIMEGLEDGEDAALLADKIIGAFDKNFQISGHELKVSVGIGISVYPDDGSSAERLISNADVAMSQVKGRGSSGYRFYTGELTELAIERTRLESEMHRALARGEFMVYYQPQVCLKHREIVGAEALVRWQHPELGFVAPGKFIELAEECGLIVPIGEFVLREACRQMVEWMKRGFSMRRIAVNIAGPQIKRVDMVALVHDVLRQSGLPPFRLELEITEGFIMDEPEQTIDLLKQLRELGVELAIDDFGTGHSSLSYIRQFPVHKVKIDQSFIREVGQNEQGKAVVRAIISLGHALGLNVIAEGVETKEDQIFLQREGCDEGQGYFYSRPVAADEFTRLLEQM